MRQIATTGQLQELVVVAMGHVAYRESGGCEAAIRRVIYSVSHTCTPCLFWREGARVSST